MTVNILGAEYTIKTGVKEEDDAHFSSSEADGYIDYQTKEIIIKEMPEPSHGLTNDIPSYERLVIRHELAHAFLYESGLTDYAADEQLVEWLAVQFPKIAKLFEELNV
jgi:Zn-dependent peptidase ImmA (M78 family)